MLAAGSVDELRMDLAPAALDSGTGSFGSMERGSCSWIPRR
jgi:hypothetical protein